MSSATRVLQRNSQWKQRSNAYQDSKPVAKPVYNDPKGSALDIAAQKLAAKIRSRQQQQQVTSGYEEPVAPYNEEEAYNEVTRLKISP